MIIEEMKFHRKQVIESAISRSALAEYKEIIRKKCIEAYVMGENSTNVVLKSNPFLRDYIIEALKDWAESEQLELRPYIGDDKFIIVSWGYFEEEEEEENGL